MNSIHAQFFPTPHAMQMSFVIGLPFMQPQFLGKKSANTYRIWANILDVGTGVWGLGAKFQAHFQELL